MCDSECRLVLGCRRPRHSSRAPRGSVLFASLMHLFLPWVPVSLAPTLAGRGVLGKNPQHRAGEGAQRGEETRTRPHSPSGRSGRGAHVSRLRALLPHRVRCPPSGVTRG